MYNVTRQIHKKYGNVIEITREESGNLKSPFQVFNQASSMRRLWIKETKSKVRILVDGQVMSITQAGKWSSDEYKSLPKCEECRQILNGDVYTHQFCDSNMFCSQSCADKNYTFQMEKINDEEECDYL